MAIANDKCGNAIFGQILEEKLWVSNSIRIYQEKKLQKFGQKCGCKKSLFKCNFVHSMCFCSVTSNSLKIVEFYLHETICMN